MWNTRSSTRVTRGKTKEVAEKKATKTLPKVKKPQMPGKKKGARPTKASKIEGICEDLDNEVGDTLGKDGSEMSEYRDAAPNRDSSIKETSDSSTNETELVVKEEISSESEIKLEMEDVSELGHNESGCDEDSRDETDDTEDTEKVNVFNEELCEIVKIEIITDEGEISIADNNTQENNCDDKMADVKLQTADSLEDGGVGEIQREEVDIETAEALEDGLKSEIQSECMNTETTESLKDGTVGDIQKVETNMETDESSKLSDVDNMQKVVVNMETDEVIKDVGLKMACVASPKVQMSDAETNVVEMDIEDGALRTVARPSDYERDPFSELSEEHLSCLDQVLLSCAQSQPTILSPTGAREGMTVSTDVEMDITDDILTSKAKQEAEILTLATDMTDQSYSSGDARKPEETSDTPPRKSARIGDRVGKDASPQDESDSPGSVMGKEDERDSPVPGRAKRVDVTAFTPVRISTRISEKQQREMAEKIRFENRLQEQREKEELKRRSNVGKVPGEVAEEGAVKARGRGRPRKVVKDADPEGEREKTEGDRQQAGVSGDEPKPAHGHSRHQKRSKSASSHDDSEDDMPLVKLKPKTVKHKDESVKREISGSIKGREVSDGKHTDEEVKVTDGSQKAEDKDGDETTAVVLKSSSPLKRRKSRRSDEFVEAITDLFTPDGVISHEDAGEVGKKREVEENRKREMGEKDERGQKVADTRKEGVEASSESGEECVLDEVDPDFEPPDDQLYCFCKKPYNNRFMICCDRCETWYHGSCVGITKARGKEMDVNDEEYICPLCAGSLSEKQRQMIRDVEVKNVGKIPRRGSKPVVEIPEPVPDKRQSLTANYLIKTETDILMEEEMGKEDNDSNEESATKEERTGLFDTVLGDKDSVKNTTETEKSEDSTDGAVLKLSEGETLGEIRKRTPESQRKKHHLSVDDTKKRRPMKIHKEVHKKSQDKCIVPECQNLAYEGALYCGKLCVSTHASDALKVIRQERFRTQGVVKIDPTRKVMVLEPKTGRVITGPPAPTEGNLVDWLVKHPSFQAMRPTKSTPIKINLGKESSGHSNLTSFTDQSASADTDEGPNPVRLNVRKALRDAFANRVQRADDIMLSNSEVKALSLSIEGELYKYFTETGNKYKMKYRSLLFNIRDLKNEGLFRKILTGKINPYKLVRMTAEELASKELAKWRKLETKHTLQMIELTEKEAMKSRIHVVKKTHKGELEVEAEDLTDLADKSSVTESSSTKRKTSDVKLLPGSDVLGGILNDTTTQHKSHLFDPNCRICTGKVMPPSPSMAGKIAQESGAVGGSEKQKTVKMEQTKEDEVVEESEVVAALEAIQKVQEVQEVQEVIHKAQGEAESEEGVVESSTTTPVRADSLVPANNNSDITLCDLIEMSPDSVLQSGLEKGSRFEPTSPALWRGFIHMQDVGKFATAAYRVAGKSDNLGLPDTLEVCGRISPEHVWDYLSKIKQLDTKELCVLRFIPGTNEEKSTYIQLYSYLNSRARCGVVSGLHKAIKDMYIYPLSSHQKIPPVLASFKTSGLDSSRPHMLLGIVVIQRQKRRALHHHGHQYSDASSTPTDTKKSRKLASTPTPPATPKTEAYDPAQTLKETWHGGRKKSAERVDPIVKKYAAAKDTEDEEDVAYSPGQECSRKQDTTRKSVKAKMSINSMIDQITQGKSPAEVTAATIASLTSNNDVLEQKRLLLELTKRVEEQKRLLQEKKNRVLSSAETTSLESSSKSSPKPVPKPAAVDPRLARKMAASLVTSTASSTVNTTVVSSANNKQESLAVSSVTSSVVPSVTSSVVSSVTSSVVSSLLLSTGSPVDLLTVKAPASIPPPAGFKSISPPPLVLPSTFTSYLSSFSSTAAGGINSESSSTRTDSSVNSNSASSQPTPKEQSLNDDTDSRSRSTLEVSINKNQILPDASNTSGVSGKNSLILPKIDASTLKLPAKDSALSKSEKSSDFSDVVKGADKTAQERTKDHESHSQKHDDANESGKEIDANRSHSREKYSSERQRHGSHRHRKRSESPTHKKEEKHKESPRERHRPSETHHRHKEHRHHGSKSPSRHGASSGHDSHSPRRDSRSSRHEDSRSPERNHKKAHRSRSGSTSRQSHSPSRHYLSKSPKHHKSNASPRHHVTQSPHPHKPSHSGGNTGTVVKEPSVEIKNKTSLVEGMKEQLIEKDESKSDSWKPVNVSGVSVTKSNIRKPVKLEINKPMKVDMFKSDMLKTRDKSIKLSVPPVPSTTNESASETKWRPLIVSKPGGFEAVSGEQTASEALKPDVDSKPVLKPMEAKDLQEKIKQNPAMFDIKISPEIMKIIQTAKGLSAAKENETSSGNSAIDGNPASPNSVVKNTIELVSNLDIDYRNLTPTNIPITGETLQASTIPTVSTTAPSQDVDMRLDLRAFSALPVKKGQPYPPLPPQPPPPPLPRDIDERQAMYNPQLPPHFIPPQMSSNYLPPDPNQPVQFAQHHDQSPRFVPSPLEPPRFQPPLLESPRFQPPLLEAPRFLQSGIQPHPPGTDEPQVLPPQQFRPHDFPFHTRGDPEQWHNDRVDGGHQWVDNAEQGGRWREERPWEEGGEHPGDGWRDDVPHRPDGWHHRDWDHRQGRGFERGAQRGYLRRRSAPFRR